MTDLVALQQFIDDGIPAVKEWDKTLFDIAGFSHYENVISNVYAWFLDPAESHGLGTLFIDSLQKLIGTSYEFDNPVVYREYGFSGQQRIDLVVENYGEEDISKPTHALIIENKMFHHLHNNLDDYYNHFEVTDDNKKGVLLTLKPQNPNNEQFVNITHQQWLQVVWSEMENLILDLPEDTLYHLKQFTRNLNNYVMHQQAKEHFTFYKKNQKEINQLVQLKTELDRHIWEQLNNIPNYLPEYQLETDYRKPRTYSYLTNKNSPNVMFTIIPKIIDESKPSVYVIVELWYDALKKLDDIDQYFIENQEHASLKLPKIEQHIKNEYMHYAEKQFAVNEDNIENLGHHIAAQIISSPLIDIYKHAKKVLYPSNQTNA